MNNNTDICLFRVFIVAMLDILININPLGISRYQAKLRINKNNIIDAINRIQFDMILSFI